MNYVMEYLHVIIPVVTGGAGWLVGKYTIVGLKNTITTEINTLKTEVTALKAKLP